MTKAALAQYPDADWPPAASGPGPEIIQRISADGLSDVVKASRMGDAELELVSRSQKGDPAAFEELVRQYQRMVHALTYRMTGSAADAEDLAQEVFLRAYEQVGSFHGAARFSTWLYRIAINTCLNWRQSEARRQDLYARAATELAIQHAGNEARPGGSAEEVQAALQKLPAKQRAAIVLTIYDGLNHAQAAEVLGCSETTVSWRIFAAKRKLKRFLTACSHVPAPSSASAKTALPDGPASGHE
jgi:RNA polymerase sigma-70 factor (ECF subfamily)